MTKSLWDFPKFTSAAARTGLTPPTRIAVQTVLEFLAAGDSVEEVLAEYPKLTRADVQACLNYASRVMGNHFSVVQMA